MSSIEILTALSPLPNLLDEQHRLALRRAADFDAIPRDTLRVWCHQHARYGLPTVELIDWLKPLIANRHTIEIGAGNGDLACRLDIRATDSWIMTNPAVAEFYRRSMQPVIAYPSWVEKIDALAAIDKYKPDIVVASWVTHWIDPNLPVPEGGGSIFGVREDQIVALGIPYIFIGNLGVHWHKPIRKLKHQELSLPFLCSRARDPSLDRVMIWNGNLLGKITEIDE